MALLGIRHRDIVRDHDTCQVGFAFVPASFLSFKLRCSEVLNYGITCWLGKYGTGGVAVMGLENFWFVLRATARQTLAHYLIGSRIVLDLHYRCVTGVSLRRSGRKVEVRHLFSSTLVGCKRDQSAVNVPCRSITSGVHRVLFTMLNPSSDFPRVLLGTAEEGSKYGTFPSYSERHRSCLTRPAVLCSPACVR